jgi:hypothetical protein
MEYFGEMKRYTTNEMHATSPVGSSITFSLVGGNREKKKFVMIWRHENGTPRAGRNRGWSKPA